MNNILNFYKNKNVLITGHTGFKGSWLTTWLINLGANIIGYSLEPETDPSIFNILKLKNKINHIIADINDYEKLNRVITKNKPEIIFHLAAQSLVRKSYEYPKETYLTNVIGTINLLEAARNKDFLKSIIIITTDKCYENKEWMFGYRENDPLGGYDPYSSSKACAEIVTAAYRNSFFNLNDYGKKHNTAIASARAGNIIGGGDWAVDRIIPDCIRSLSKNEDIIVRYPEAVRPWQFVLEPIYGYLKLAVLLYRDGKKYSEAWNFGPNYNNCIKVEELVEKVIKLWGTGNFKYNKNKTFHESQFLKLDISKSIFKLKWEPIYNINKTIEETIIWYKKYFENENMFENTINQLDDYLNSLLEKEE